jgi:hypothetical protein
MRGRRQPRKHVFDVWDRELGSGLDESHHAAWDRCGRAAAEEIGAQHVHGHTVETHEVPKRPWCFTGIHQRSGPVS